MEAGECKSIIYESLIYGRTMLLPFPPFHRTNGDYAHALSERVWLAYQEGSQNPDLLDWFDDSLQFLPSFLDDQYSISDNIPNMDWWADQSLDPNQDSIFELPTAASATSATDSPVEPTNAPQASSTAQHESCNKRKRNERSNTSANLPQTSSRKTSSKANGSNSSNSSSSKEVRWAEQLLNPLAAAIESNNLSRVQHLLYVLQELASPNSDPNHRLAYHGLCALSQHIDGNLMHGDRNHIPPLTFATVDPKTFRSSLIKFHEVSPWFSFPNFLANSSILQTLNFVTAQQPKSIHIIDMGVSHGIQWPTFLESLSRRSNSPPPHIKLSTVNDSTQSAPFSCAPPDYDFSDHLLRYAKSLNLNLEIERISSIADIVQLNQPSILVFCIQFRNPSVSFLQSAKSMKPDLVILTEINDGGGEVEVVSFAKKAETTWRFLESTSAAFKGKECVERRVMEGEMARVLGNELKWERMRERMVGLGFEELEFGEEAADGGKGLLKKYDGGWEMVRSTAGIALWWKGCSVSFCSIWKVGKIED